MPQNEKSAFSNFYRHPVFSFCAFLSLCVLLAFFFLNIDIGQSYDQKYIIYSVRFEYFGVDADELEKKITIPLEDRLKSLSGLMELVSTAEYGKTNTTAYFKKTADSQNTYLTIRDIVETLYARLPDAVQKPRIYSSSSNQQPVINIACLSESLSVDEIRRYAESNIKPQIEAVDGVSEAMVLGGHIAEIGIEFDNDRLAAGGLNPDALAALVRDSNVIIGGGKVVLGTADRDVSFDTQLASLEEMRQLPVLLSENEITRLRNIAHISARPRAQEEIVKINGVESILLSVDAASSGNIFKISRQCKLIVHEDQNEKIQFRVLYDDGDLVFQVIKKLLFAVLQSFLLAIVFIPLFLRSRRTVFLIVITLPMTVFFTASLLSALGISLDRNTLAGISISLGLVIDTPLVLSEASDQKNRFADFTAALRPLFVPVFFSMLTTVIAFIPLFFLENLVPGTRDVVITISLMLVVSVFLSLVFFPCFAYSVSTRDVLPEFLRHKIFRFIGRFSFFMTNISLGNKKTIGIVYGFLMAAPFVLFPIIGKNISTEINGGTVRASIEFESETAASSADTSAGRLISLAGIIDGVTYVSTEARKGVVEMTVGFDAKRTSEKKLASEIRALAPYCPGAYLYVPDASSDAKGNMLTVEIAIIGDDSALCRGIAEKTAENIAKYPATEQVVLNFKDPEETVVFTPDNALVVKNNISTADIAGSLRWFLFGPVADKWIQDGEEMDIRIAGRNDGVPSFNTVPDIYISTPNGSVRLASLGSLKKTTAIGKIYRKDGRRAAYITAHVLSKSADRTMKELHAYLQGAELPKGYGFSFSRELEDLSKHYRMLFGAFLASVAALFILLTALSEKPLKALLVLSVIPVSMSLPLFIRFFSGTPLAMGDIVGMVVLSGISINNAIYISESQKQSVRNKAREKIRSILLTSITTIAGAVPLLLLPGNGFSASMAFFMLWGTLGSLASALLLFPKMLWLFEKRRAFPSSKRQANYAG